MPVVSQRREESKMIKLSASNVVGLIILMCILAAMVSIAVMQVVRTVEDVGAGIYIVGGAVVVVGAMIPIMLIILVKHLQKINQS
jgi:hypothetical protein